MLEARRRRKEGIVMASKAPPKTDAEEKTARMEKRATDAARAMNEAQAEARRIDENTLRLRALRLAKEEKERAAAERAASRPPPPPKAKPAAKAKAKAGKSIPVRKLNAQNDG
jgi:hypothetical protein